MHEQWQDLMPFYLAGTLSRAEAAALESHLAGCAECQLALNEWRIIAEVVKAEGQMRARALPPLAKSTRESIKQENTAAQNGRVLSLPTQPNQPAVKFRQPAATLKAMKPIRTRQTRFPVTMAAAAVIVFVLGGILIFAMSRPPADENFADENESIAALPSYTPRIRLTETPTVTITPTQEQELGIISTARPPSTFVPSTLPSGAGGGIGGGGFVPQTITSALVAPESVLEGCAITNITTFAQKIYQSPDVTSLQVGLLNPQETLAVFQRSADWYNVIGTDNRIFGWIYGDGLSLTDACVSLPQPTPTTPYNGFIGLLSYDFATTADLGAIPINSRVRIASAYYNGTEWVYNVIAEGTLATAEAREWQIRTLYGSNEITPTPTVPFQDLIGMSQFNAVTTETLGAIPANTRVRISVMGYESDNTPYFIIIAPDGITTAKAYPWQLKYAPEVTPGAPTPTHTPMSTP